MKIALIFWGITRSLKNTYPNIKKLILDHLKTNKIQYKIFLHTYKFEGALHNQRTGENNINLDFEEYKLLNPDYFQIDNQDIIKKQININQYFNYKFTYNKQTITNLICALYSQMRATKMLEDSGEKFDYIWYLRPDVIFKNYMPLNWFRWVNPGRFITPTFGHSGGINDRFAILTYNLALIYGKRFLRFKEYCEIKKKIGGKISSERFLSWIMKEYKNRKVSYLFKRLRATGHYHILDDKLF